MTEQVCVIFTYRIPIIHINYFAIKVIDNLGLFLVTLPVCFDLIITSELKRKGHFIINFLSFFEFRFSLMKMKILSLLEDQIACERGKYVFYLEQHI